MTEGLAVLALVTDGFGSLGGIAQYNRDLIQAFASTDCVATIAVLPRVGRNAELLSPKIAAAAPPKGKAAYILATIASAFSGRTDVVFCGHVNLVVLAWIIARLRGAKLVVQLHGIEAWEHPGYWSRRALEGADLVLCVSRYTRARLAAFADLEPERVLVLPNTVSETFAPSTAPLDTRPGRKTLLTVGRMSGSERYKGHEPVMAAMPRLLRAGLDIQYLIVGEGDDRARLEQLAAEAGIADRVRFLGPLDNAALAQCYRDADLFVMPSTGEGFGIAFLEAMASGTPALGIDAGGATDPLGDGELGELAQIDRLAEAIEASLRAPPRDPAALAAAVTSRFGRQTFEANVGRLVQRLCEAA